MMRTQPQKKPWADRFLDISQDLDADNAGAISQKLANALRKIPENAPGRAQAVQTAFDFWVAQLLRRAAEHAQKDKSGSEMSTLNEAALTVLKALKPDEQNAYAPALLGVWHDMLEDRKIYPPRAHEEITDILKTVHHTHRAQHVRAALDLQHSAKNQDVFSNLYRQRTADILSTLRPDDLKTLTREELAFRAQAAEEALEGSPGQFFLFDDMLLLAGHFNADKYPVVGELMFEAIEQWHEQASLLENYNPVAGDVLRAQRVKAVLDIFPRGRALPESFESARIELLDWTSEMAGNTLVWFEDETLDTIKENAWTLHGMFCTATRGEGYTDENVAVSKLMRGKHGFCTLFRKAADPRSEQPLVATNNIVGFSGDLLRDIEQKGEKATPTDHEFQQFLKEFTPQYPA